MNKSQKARTRKVVQHLDKTLDFLNRAIGELPREKVDLRNHLVSVGQTIEGLEAALRSEMDAKQPKPDDGQTDIEDHLKARARG